MPKDYLISCYKEKFKELLIPLGFKLKGKKFYRILDGEVIQAVGIRKHRIIRGFTINFDFTALCTGIDVSWMASEFESVAMYIYGDDLYSGV